MSRPSTTFSISFNRNSANAIPTPGQEIVGKNAEISSDSDDGDFDDVIFEISGEQRGFTSSKSNVSGSLDFGKKIDLSTRVQNDIVRSEKKSEKRPNYYGRDDRATSEQVLDPRTRLILFKLLSSGFIVEIDGISIL